MTVTSCSYLNEVPVDLAVWRLWRPPVEDDGGRVLVLRRGRKNRQVSRWTRRSRFPGLVDGHQAPGALPRASHDLDGELVLCVGLQVVEHDVEVGGVAILVPRFVHLRRLLLRVADDVVTVVGDHLVPGKNRQSILLKPEL